MNEKNASVRYELPSHRIKILGSTIFGLVMFLLYALSRLNENVTFFDFLLISAAILIGLWFKKFLNKYSSVGFLLNEIGLLNLDETIICQMEDIKNVDVSPYTFKSANGFIIHLKAKRTFKSVPGLYWQLGKRISIGGLVSKSESKFLSGTLLQFHNQEQSSQH